MADGSLAGQLLIAAPALLDPNFVRSVVLVTAHSEEGAMGVVLNRPSETNVAEALPILEPLVAPDDPVHVGGPVEPGAVVALAEFEDPDEAAAVVFERVGFLGGGETGAPATRRARVFAGYAGWGPGQLEGELEEESWFLEPAVVEDVFSPVAAELWSTVLRRKGGQFALLALMPLDPSSN